MKSHFLLPLALLSFFTSAAQFGYGIKGGLNYDTFGDITEIGNSLNAIKSEPRAGFHFGLYGNIDLLLFYLRPELQFSKSESVFEDAGSLSLNKIEAPILLGYKVLGGLSVFAGPSFQYILKDKASEIKLGDLKEDFTVGLQIGSRIKLGRLGLGVRFERGFTENEITVLGNNNVDLNGKIDTRPKQWIISASYQLKAKDKKDND